MIDTILFDLDGTLLPLDMERFIALYFGEMAAYFDGMIEPKLLVKHILTATAAMVDNVEHRTNETVFMECFSRLIQSDLAVYQARFQKFYDQGFIKTKAATMESQVMKQSVALLKQKGYHLAIATNPIFPRQAIAQRVAWAGFALDDFCYITSYEQNHYCKPQPQFYQEVLAALGKKPAECLMVGNDVEEDLVARDIGIKTFLITDYLITRSQRENDSDYQGNYQDFYRFVREECKLARN
jgi:FMN phosphatase YigB (HAD superfamily)